MTREDAWSTASDDPTQFEAAVRGRRASDELKLQSLPAPGRQQTQTLDSDLAKVSHFNYSNMPTKHCAKARATFSTQKVFLMLLTYLHLC